MALVSARSPTSLVGLIGPFSAGKTSFLTSLFVHFAETGVVGNHAFAGSYTVDGWTRLKRYTEWPTMNGPTFPPHTPDNSDRVPSLLHLAFRDADTAVRDFLFTDAPGEWFTRWVRNQSADDARGANWIADHATQFLFFVDRSALAGPSVGKARQDVLALARILAERRGERPVATLWTKSDSPCDMAVEEPIKERLKQFFGPHPSWDTQVQDRTCLKVLNYLLTPSEKPCDFCSRRQWAVDGSAFLSYAGSK